VGDFTARQADKAMVSNVKVVLRMIGSKLNAQMHDDAMPVRIHSIINWLFASMWPEIQKGVLDKLLLEKGWQFRNYRKQLKTSQAAIPSGLKWLHATLIYSVAPYDRSFFGLIRSPLFLLMKLIFLFPLYGVDSICVISYWLSLYKYDEHQLVSFIIKSKALAFITTGLISGAMGFIKLYMCATRWDPHGPGSCELKAPGMNKTFWFEYTLFLVRTVLVWITFLILWKFEEVQAWKKRRDAERNRMAAVERRGLFPPKTTRYILLCSWLLSWYCMWAVLHAADVFTALRLSVSTIKSHTDVNNTSEGSDSLSQLADTLGGLWGSTTTDLTLSPFKAAIVIFLLQQLPVSVLLNVPQMKATGATAGAMTSVAVIVFMIHNLYVGLTDADILTKNFDEVLAYGSVITLSMFTLTLMVLLVLKQREAHWADKETMERFETVMLNLDKDGDGEVSKAEFKVAFKELFPNSKFEPVWKQIDQDGDGSLSMAELANHFGMGHLIKEQPQEEVKKIDDDDLEDMFSIESKLDSMVEASAFSEKAGGVITYFLIWDLISFAAVGSFVLMKVNGSDESLDSQWRLRTSLYFSKEMLGLLSLPFLVFQVPVVKDALTHTKKTGYDRAGKCMAELNAQEKSNRYAVIQEARKLRYEQMMKGMMVSPAEWIELKWNAFLGFPELDKKKVKQAKKKILNGQLDSVISLGQDAENIFKDAQKNTLDSIKKLNPANALKIGGKKKDANGEEDVSEEAKVRTANSGAKEML